MRAIGVSARWRVVAPLAAVPLGAVWPVRRIAAQSTPTEDSADAGFAYDMIRHHAQAVEMAMMLYKRTDDPVLSVMAYDIALTQQAQIGMMLGWLDVWGLPRTSTRPAMAWMGHPVEGPMPGMATSDEVESLRELPLAEMEAQFLRLMIRHHQGGVEMAEAGVGLVETPQARELAATIAASQTAEIEQMQQMLEERGLPRVTGDVSGGEEGEHATPDHGHGG
jgi:uncharacterized protein (DUF305 family)